MSRLEVRRVTRHLHGLKYTFVALLVIAISSYSAVAQEPKPDLMHGSDGRLDMSGFLATRGGFLPAPIIITEPAVGYGGGLAAAFFHGGNPLENRRRTETGRPLPPSVSVAGAFGTENGSSGAGAGHMGIWKGDTIRYFGAIGQASFNLDYWGSAERPLPQPLSYGVSGTLVFQRLLFRIGNSPLLLGGEWTWSKQKSEFVRASLPPGSPPRKNEETDSGAGFVGEYETLDNIFTPLHGMKGRIIAKKFSESLGGDNDREKLRALAFGYVPLGGRLNLGLRGDASFSDGETPFYLLPYLDMRGLPAMKYAGKHVAQAEGELRWNIERRWSVIAFGGVGFTANSVPDLFDDSVGTIGGGVRYLIAERYGIHCGLDYGQGPAPGDHAVYIVVGNAWR